VYYYTNIHELSKIPFIICHMHCIQRFKIQDSSSAETQRGYTDTTAKQYIVVGSLSVYNTNTGKGLQRYGTSDR